MQVNYEKKVHIPRNKSFSEAYGNVNSNILQIPSSIYYAPLIGVINRKS